MQFHQYLYPAIDCLTRTEDSFITRLRHGSFHLRDRGFSEELMIYVQDADNLVAWLGGAKDYEDSAFCMCLKMVHHQLRAHVLSQKHNRLKNKIASHLYELLPDAAERQKLVPAIKIDLGDGVKHRFNMILRPKRRPARVRCSGSMCLSDIR